MNDPRYRRPSRPPNSQSFTRGPRGNPDGPGFDEEPAYRPPRGPRNPGGPPPDWRPPRGFGDPTMPPGRRSSRGFDDQTMLPGSRPPRRPDDPDAGFERRPARGPRDPEMNPGMRPPRGPRPPDTERSGRGRGGPPLREDWPEEHSEPEWEQGMRPRRPSRRPGKASTRQPPTTSRRKLSRRYRYGALLGIMLFAVIGGLSLGFSGVGFNQHYTVLLVVAAAPALLLSIACAVAFVAF